MEKIKHNVLQAGIASLTALPRSVVVTHMLLLTIVFLSASTYYASPIANDDEYQVLPNETLTVGPKSGLLANDSDPDGDPISIQSIGTSENGTIDFNSDGSFTYTPNKNFTGTESISYTISDGNSTADATLRIIVNTPPIAIDDTYTVPPNDVLNPATYQDGLLGNDSDPEGNPIEVVSISPPQNGVFLNEGPDGIFTYVPDEDFVGVEELTYTITDGFSNVSASLIIKVNTRPFPEDDNYTTPPNITLTVDAASGVLANDTDPDGQNLEVTGFTNPGVGTLNMITDGSFTYTPPEGFTGQETISYSVSDGIEEVGALVFITVEAEENSPPVAMDDNYTTPPNITLTVDAESGVLANDTDPEGQELEVTGFTNPGVGTLNMETDGSFTYTPPEGFTGQETISYSVSDGIAEVGALVFITVDPEATAPLVAVDDTYTTPPNITLTVDAESGVLANDTGPEGQNLEVTGFTNPGVGTLNMETDGSFTYTPPEDFTGVEELTYTISDGDSNDSAILIIKVNTRPFPEDDNYTTPPNTTLTVDAASGVLANDTDPDGQNLEVTGFTNPGVGTLNMETDGSFTYTPPDGFTGQETISYSVSDGIEQVGALVFITVESEATAPPIAENDSYTTEFNTLLSLNASEGVLANDSDPDGDVLEVISFEEAENGEVSIESNGAFTYLPFDGFIGQDMLTYTISDGSLTSEGILNIDVVDTPPISASSCELYDPQPLSRGFGGLWQSPEAESSANFYVPASQRGGGIIKATLSAGNGDITPNLRVCKTSSCSGGSIATHTAIETGAATVEFQAAAGNDYHFDILQFGNAPEDDYPVAYSLTVSYEDRIDCWEGNNTVDEAKQINIGEEVEAYMLEGFKDNALQSGEYADWYTFELEVESFIEVTMPQPPGQHLMRVKLFDEPDEDVADILLDGQQQEKGAPFTLISTRARAPGTYYLRIGVLDSDNGKVSGSGDQPEHWNQTYKMTVAANTSTSTEDDILMPKSFDLSQNYPNPFNPSTTIEFALPQAEMVRLDVFNSIGKQVSSLVDEQLPAGNHSITFDASNLPSGIYMYRIKAGSFVRVKKLTLIK